jgi:Flp pilus assembly protein TadG
MNFLSVGARIRGFIERLARDERGVSAVEFAMLLPMMLAAYFGTVEISQGVTIDRKVTLVARTIADLVSQSQTITNADMTNIIAAGTAVAAPFSSSILKVTVSSVMIDANSNAKVVWSDATSNATARPVNQVVTSIVPQALRTANTTLIWSEVQYGYTPTIGWVISGTINLADQMYMRPRFVSCVTRTTSNGSVC